jgi:hypothetical protein
VPFTVDHGFNRRRADQIREVGFQDPVVSEQRRCCLAVTDVHGRAPAVDEPMNRDLVLEVSQALFERRHAISQPVVVHNPLR